MMIKKIIFLISISVLATTGSLFAASPVVHYKISGDLSGLIAKRADAISRNGVVAGDEKRKVIFYVKDTVTALKNISSHGGGIIKRKKNLVIANVSIDKVDDIVNNGSGIAYARLPRKFFPCEIISEGVNLTGAKALQTSSVTGKGVKIAVLDIGFKGLSAAITNGEIPSGVKSYDFSGKGLETQYKHGTACAEIIHDMAPDAELYLLKVGDETNLDDAATYCKNNGIKIVSISLGTFGTGPGNGTGPFDDICEDLKNNGILVVVAAGNAGNVTESGITVGQHWRGTFTDSGHTYNGSNIANQFIPGDANGWYNTIIAASSTDDDGNIEVGMPEIAMRWDAWPPAGGVDYDMFLLDNDTGALVASSTTVQDGSIPPLEFIPINVPTGTQYKIYKLVVTKKSGQPDGKEVEIMLGGSCFFYPFGGRSYSISTSTGSISEPADSPSVVTVGAINYTNWTTGPQEDFSSQGPTNAWAGSSARIKPDICGPDGTSSYTYGASAFSGTSAATPHVAGAAALVLSMHPQYTVDQLRAAIEQNAVDMGSTGKDNIYGNGRLQVGKSLNTPPVLSWTGETGYVSDGLEPEAGNSLTPLTFKIKYTDADGDAPVVHDIYIDRNGDGDYADAGEVVSMTATGSDYKSGVIYTYVTNIPYSSGSSNCSYYFKFSDGVDYATGNITSAISPQTAINKPDIFQSLSLTIDHTNWQLSVIQAGSKYVTDNSSKVKVTNDGDGPESYSLRIANEGSGWSAAISKDGTDVNKFVLSAVFSDVSTTSVDSSYFNETGNEDVISTTVNKANQTVFGSLRLPAGGFSVLPGSDRDLWLEFKAPTSDTTRLTQSISVTLNAETQ